MDDWRLHDKVNNRVCFRVCSCPAAWLSGFVRGSWGGVEIARAGSQQLLPYGADAFIFAICAPMATPTFMYVMASWP